MILVIFLVFGFIQYTLAIECSTCNTWDNSCPLPINFDGGDESNEAEVDFLEYDPGYVCQSIHFIQSKTGVEVVILRGVKRRKCIPINIVNRRIYCCFSNNCNRRLPPMKLKPIIYSSGHQKHLPSIIFISFSVIFSILQLK